MPDTTPAAALLLLRLRAAAPTSKAARWLLRLLTAGERAGPGGAEQKSRSAPTARGRPARYT